MNADTTKLRLACLIPLILALWAAMAAADAPPLRFVILGDRTGEAVPGVYEQVWREAAAENPAFAVTVGDSIQGLHDDMAAAEWREVDEILKPYRRFPIYLAAGNHDIWSAPSEQLFREHAGAHAELQLRFRRGALHGAG